MSQGLKPVQGSARRERSIWTYLAFVLFGSGSAWIVVGAVYLELAIYEEELGLLAGNRCSLGYQAGALLVPLFAAARMCLQRLGKEVDYRGLIVALAIVNLLNLSLASFGVHSLEALILVTFLGGGCGYLSGVVHQAYLVLNCEDVYSAAFWAGDATAGLISAVLALVQRPDLGKEGRRFSSGALYCMLIPVVVMGLGMFWIIERKALGFLPEKKAEKLAAAGALLPGELELSATGGGGGGAEVPSAADATLDQAPGGQDASELEGGPAATKRAAAAPPEPEALGRGLAESPQEGRRRQVKGESVPFREAAQAKVSNCGEEAELDPDMLKAEELEDGEVKVAPPELGGGFARLLPAGAAARPGYTAALLLLGFWMSFTCWGIGDSVIPYACEQSSAVDVGKTCLFRSSLATVVAILVGSSLAGIAIVPTFSQLVAPGVIYTVAFGFLCLAAAWGGRWAQPLAGPAASSLAAGGASAQLNGGGYIILLVVLMRGLQPFVQVMRQRLIQKAYEPEDREEMNLVFYGCTVAANIIGVIVVTVLLS